MLANMEHKLYKEIESTKLLPLYTATDLECLPLLEKVLLENNVKLIEVTFRSDLALDAIRILSKSGKLIVGAGTVRTLVEAKNAIQNGAQFLVSPAIVPEVIEYAIANDIPIFPGTATPGDIQRALEYGIKVVKFFPADIYGGLNAIKALSGPFYDVRFLPTGGINEQNYLEYLENDSIIAVGGSFIISELALKKDQGIRASETLKRLVQGIN